jgi:glycosyltransferase involved in cell wall biosynthesis
VSAGFGLIYVAPFPPRGPGLPNRPRALLGEMQNQEQVKCLTVVGRLRPSRFLRHREGRGGVMGSRVVAIASGHEVVEHPWPFGPLEARMLRRLVLDHLSKAPGRWVLWISDPKSAITFASLRDIPASRLVRVFDAYDAWDLSPLVRGRMRRRAVASGYQQAARYADVVFANTEFMARRIRDLGATDVSVIQNGAPRVATAVTAPDRSPGQEPYLVYVGRIHERLDAGLLMLVADAFPQVRIRLIGPVERIPDGWAAFIARPNVSLEGPVVGERLRDILTDAEALVLPHRVDDYTRSQDAMKAWDAIAVGTPVIATPLPPVVGWPAGLARIGADGETFVAGVRSVLNGDLDPYRESRLRFARVNGWDARAATAIRAIEGVFDR